MNTLEPVPELRYFEATIQEARTNQREEHKVFERGAFIDVKKSYAIKVSSVLIGA